MRTYQRVIQFFYMAAMVLSGICIFPTYFVIDYSHVSVRMGGMVFNADNLQLINQSVSASNYYRFWPILIIGIIATLFCLFKYKRAVITALGLVQGVQLFWMTYMVYFMQDSLVASSKAVGLMLGKEYGQMMDDLARTIRVVPSTGAILAIIFCVLVVVSTLLCFIFVPNDEH